MLHVVVYNGDKRWDAPLTLAGLVERTERDGPAQLAASYDVVDLVTVKADDLPRANLLRWVAEVEQGAQTGALPERVRELLEKIDRWEAEILERGIEQGIERHRVLLHRLAERRFGPAAAERLSAVLAGVTDADRLAEAGGWIVDSAATADFLAHVSRAGA